MTPEQVIAAVDKYEKLFGTTACTPVPRERFPREGLEPSGFEAQKHMLWMCEQTRDYAKTDVEKAMRWLGFIQGILWTKLGVSIEEMMVDNKPPLSAA